MPFFDFPLPELEAYRPNVREPEDFDVFWEQTLREKLVGNVENALTVSPQETTLSAFDVSDVTFPGYAGQTIHALYLRPRTNSPHPVVVEFVGYGGGRGLPEEHLAWAASGFGHLIVDTRGQGTRWSGGGDTGDTADAGPSGGGLLTRGITSPRDYYYRRVFTDAAQAARVARLLPGADPESILLTGSSQGAGITIAAAALDQNIQGFMANVPFLCNFERAIGLTGRQPYEEVVEYLAVKRDQVETVFTTLSYFDGVNFARRTSAPSLFSVALMDTVTPPSTGFAARNWCPQPAQMEVYAYNGHEGGGPYQLQKQLRWATSLTGI